MLFPVRISTLFYIGLKPLKHVERLGEKSFDRMVDVLGNVQHLALKKLTHVGSFFKSTKRKAHHIILFIPNKIQRGIFHKRLVTSISPPHISEESQQNSNIIPEDFFCYISQDVMFDPVIAADGKTYDRKFLEEWIRRSPTSPLTRQDLSNTQLKPDIEKQKEMNKFFTENPKLKPKDWDKRKLTTTVVSVGGKVQQPRASQPQNRIPEWIPILQENEGNPPRNPIRAEPVNIPEPFHFPAALSNSFSPPPIVQPRIPPSAARLPIHNWGGLPRNGVSPESNPFTNPGLPQSDPVERILRNLERDRRATVGSSELLSSMRQRERIPRVETRSPLQYSGVFRNFSSGSVQNPSSGLASNVHPLSSRINLPNPSQYLNRSLSRDIFQGNVFVSPPSLPRMNFDLFRHGNSRNLFSSGLFDLT